jgi:hypothetical protein
LAYDGPREAGGHCFVAVGRGGWAVEAEVTTSKHAVVVFGATIRPAARVRLGRVTSVRTLPFSKRFGVRFFAARVPRRAADVLPNRIAALDRHGRVLGRQHYNDGHGGFGRCNGWWDRRYGACRRGP